MTEPEFPELLPKLIACIAFPAYLGVMAFSPWQFVAYVCVASFALTIGEVLVSGDRLARSAHVAVKLGFWLGTTAAVGTLPYFAGHFLAGFLRSGA